jgi:phosphoribosylformylglycinamidine (FGAM) synthase PurS component
MEERKEKKRLIKWTLHGNILRLQKHLEDPKAEAVVEREFDLDKLLEAIVAEGEGDFKYQALCYLAKQRMSDKGANEVGDYRSKVKVACDRWEEMVARQWKGERVNATGASEDRKLGKAVKEMSQVRDLNGLIIKQALHPEAFTEDDKVELSRLMAVKVAEDKKLAEAAKHSAKNKE